MNNAPETPAPVPAHIPKHLARDFDLWAELTAHGENAINQSGCVGHARCNNVAPALYPLDNNGYIASNGLSVPIGQERLATRGARACPERVIEVRDTSDEHR